MQLQANLLLGLSLLFLGIGLMAQQAPMPPLPIDPLAHNSCQPPTHGFLGVIMSQEREVTVINGVETINDNGKGKGVYIREIAPESAALEAGLKAGDIITAINGKATPDASVLSDIIRQTKAGDKVSIDYLRNDAAAKTTATLKGSPMAPPPPPPPPYFEHHKKGMGFNWHDKNDGQGCHKNNSSACCDKPNSARLGVNIETLDATFATKNNIKNPGGAYVSEVTDNSAAAEAGLKAGDIIRKIADNAIFSDRDVINAIGQFKPNDKVKIVYERNGKKNTTTAQLKANEMTCGSKMKGCEKGMRHIEQQKIYKLDDKDGDAPQRIEKRIIINGNGMDMEDLDMDDVMKNIEIIEMETLGDNSGEPQIIHVKIMVRDLENADLSILKDAFVPAASNGKTLPDESLRINLKQYPNPTAGKFTVSFDTPEKGTLNVRIADSVGKLVFNETLDNFSGQYQKELDLSDNAKGVYFLQIVQNGKTLNKKIILE